MLFESTRGGDKAKKFEEVLLKGLADDGGLYIPTEWPKADIRKLQECNSFIDIAKLIVPLFTESSYKKEEVITLLENTWHDFEKSDLVGIKKVNEDIFIGELFHGPTAAFKDFGLQLCAAFFNKALEKNNQTAIILGATSGDTGSAAIDACKEFKSIKSFILIPEGNMSEIQRKQMTTPTDENVHALAIDGTFDDCQALVKDMFNDADFRHETGLAGVNSINWARVMAQTVYYFTASAQLGGPDKEIAFSVPTGNFGDIFAGYVAKQMGLPIAQLMIATNINDILARVLKTGIYEIGDVVTSSSPSMDIQVSSNFERLLFEATGRDADEVCRLMGELAEKRKFSLSPNVLEVMLGSFAAERVDEGETAKIIKDMFEADGMLLDPHTAVGYGAALRSDVSASTPIVTLATAHPAKFPASVEKACNRSAEEIIATPERVQLMMQQDEAYETYPNELARVQDFIRQKNSL